MAHLDGPPGLPVIKDEAGDSPRWLPLSGLALIVLAGLAAVIMGALHPDGEDEAASAPRIEVEAAEGAPAAEAAPEPAAADVPAAKQKREPPGHEGHGHD